MSDSLQPHESQHARVDMDVISPSPIKRLPEPGREGSLARMDTCICMAESLCCSPETITVLLIGYVLCCA